MIAPAGVVNFTGPEDRTFYGKTPDEAPAWRLLGLTMPARQGIVRVLDAPPRTSAYRRLSAIGYRLPASDSPSCRLAD